MIDGYKFRDGRIIVVNYDSNNNVSEEEREYQDNIEELLYAENMEEHLNKLKNNYYEKIDEVNERKKSLSENLFIMIVVCLICTIIFGLSFSVVLLSFIPLIGTFLGLSLIGSLTNISSFKKYNRANKEIKGYKLVLEGIEREIQNNQRELRRLRSDDRAEKEYIDSEYKQLDLKELEQIDEYLDTLEYIGNNEKVFLSYMKQGLLEDTVYEGILDEKQFKSLKRVLGKKR